MICLLTWLKILLISLQDFSLWIDAHGDKLLPSKQDWTMFCWPHCSWLSTVFVQRCYTLFRLNNIVKTTHVKISQLAASLQTSRQQVVFAQLVTSCQQVWNKLLTTCNNLVDIVRLVTRLFQQDCYNHDITTLLQPWVVDLVAFLLYHECIRLVRTTL